MDRKRKATAPAAASLSEQSELHPPPLQALPSTAVALPAIAWPPVVSSARQKRPRLQQQAVLPLQGGLSTDLLARVCGHLKTRDLLTLRRVSKHWATASRLPRSWIASHFNIGKRSYRTGTLSTVQLVELRQAFKTVSHTMPYLRSLSILDSDEKARLKYKPLCALKLLERLEMPDSALPVELLPNLPHLREFVWFNLQLVHAQFVDLPDDYVQFIGALKIEQLDIHSCPCDHLVRQLTKTPLISTLRILNNLVPQGLLSIKGPEMAKLTMLEELDLLVPRAQGEIYDYQDFEDPNEQRVNWHAITCLPALRILSITACSHDHHDVRSEHLQELLANPQFNARLEYLSLRTAPAGYANLRKIMTECTSLLGLELDQRYNAGKSYRVHITSLELKPVTESQWRDSAQVNQSASATMSERQYEKSMMMTWMAAPVAFRRRLLSLRINGRNGCPAALEQLCRRYPNLASVRFDWPPGDETKFRDSDGEGDGTDDDDDDSQLPEQVDTTFPWLPAETVTDDVPDHGYKRDGPLSHADQQLQDQLPLIHWLRALKMQRGLPLTTSEIAAASRPILGRTSRHRSD